MRSEDHRSIDTHEPVTAGSNGLIGHMLGGKYQVLDFIGQGGMGSVYRVHQVFLNRIWALKLLDSTRVADAVLLRRFQQEGIAANSLNHPSLVKVHDFGLLDTEQPYLVMDLVDGETLSDYLKKNGPLPLNDINAVFAQVCFGLSYAHAEKVMHRDIKPSNIMLVRDMSFDTEGSVKIVDFGLAKIAGETEGIQALTRTGEVMGSPIYMSPEQCTGGTIDYRTDIYSLGCVLFEALTGTPPFIGESALRTMMLHQSTCAPTLKEASLGRTYPDGLERIVAKMLAKAPGDRYQDLGLVAHDLAQVCAGNAKSTEAARVAKPKQDTPPISMPLTLVAVLIVITIIASSAVTFMITRSLNTKDSPKSPAIVQEQKAPSGSGLPTEEEILGRKSQSLPDSSPQPAAHISGPIVSKIVVKNGEKVREFHFPNASIGGVAGLWWTELARDNMGRKAFYRKEAKSVTDVPTEIPLTLRINLSQQTNLKFELEALKAIGPNEFAGIMFENPMIGDELSEKQHEFITEAIDQAANWKDLRVICFANMQVGANEINAIDKLQNLQVFDAQTSAFEPDAIRHSSFLRRVEYIFSNAFSAERYVNGSTKLVSIRLNECLCTPESIAGLQSCPNLRSFSITQMEIDDKLIQAIAGLRQLTAIYIRNRDITPHQVQQLLKLPKLRTLLLDEDVIGHATAAGITDKRIVKRY